MDLRNAILYFSVWYLDPKHVAVSSTAFPFDVQSHVVKDHQVRGQQPATGGLGRSSCSAYFLVVGVEHPERPIPVLSVVHVGQSSAPTALQICAVS